MKILRSLSKVIKTLKTTYVFTHTATDSLSQRRKQLAKQTGIIFIPDKSKTVTHSTTIIKKLELEFVRIVYKFSMCKIYTYWF